MHRAIARGLPSDWPAAFVDRLAHRARLDAALELARGHEIRRVLDALALAGVRAVLFKGTALAYSRYAHPALRPRGDTDLLVPREGLGRRARRVDSRSDTPSPKRVEAMSSSGKSSSIAATHTASSTPSTCIGRSATRSGSRGCSTTTSCGGERRPSRRWVPMRAQAGAADALLISCVHPVMHHRDDDRLIWSHDTHVIASAMDAGQWSSFVELAQSEGRRRRVSPRPRTGARALRDDHAGVGRRRIGGGGEENQSRRRSI